MASTPPSSPDWAAIYAEHGQAMLMAARRVIGDHEALGQNAEDVVGDVIQELMVKGLPAKVTNLRGLLTTRTRQRAVDVVRRRGADGRAVAKTAPQEEVVEGWEDDVETGSLAAAAIEALDGLPERERYAIEQRVMLERPLKDVGNELSVTGQRVNQLVNAGLARLCKLPLFAQLGRDDPTSVGLDAGATSPHATGTQR